MSSVTVIIGIVSMLIAGFYRSCSASPPCTPPPLSDAQMQAYVKDAVADNRTLFTSMDKILVAHNLPKGDTKCLYADNIYTLDTMLSCSNGIFKTYYSTFKQNHLLDQSATTYKELEAALLKWGSGTVPHGLPGKDIPFLATWKDMVKKYFPNIHI